MKNIILTIIRILFKSKDTERSQIMKKFLSIVLSVLMILSTVIIGVGAIEENQTKAISMTVYDPQTGEETQETYYINSSDYQATSTCSHKSEAEIETNNLTSTLNLNDEFVNDGLNKVTNTSQFPYSAIGLYKITATQDYSTAFMISDNVAATAAHVLYDRKNHKWKKSGNFYPGKTGFGVGNDPFGAAYAKKWAICTEYINSDPKNVLAVMTGV